MMPIVVVEAGSTPRWRNTTYRPYNAVKQVMGEISGAIIAITLVMVSVFLPITFMSGACGYILQAVFHYHG